MSFLWQTPALVAAIQGRPLGKLPEGITGISIDTRTLQPGEAYFAIKGERLDGHDFVTSAMKAGASVAIVSEEKLVALGGIALPLIVVNDVLSALRVLAVAARKRSRAQIIAVTGSVGKTTTKEMLRTVLSSCGRVHASAASFNNHWGVPLTLARLPEEARFGVFEIGMNHPDEIRPLVKLVRPHVAMITNVAASHLGAFESLDGIAHAKAEIFEGLVSGGYGLINRDDKRYKLLGDLATDAGVEHQVSFGCKRGADFRYSDLTHTDDGSSFKISANGHTYNISLNVPGAHIAENACAVFAASLLAGAAPEAISGAFERITAQKGRGERHLLALDGGHILLIDESYNANPHSMAAALGTLGRTPAKGRRIAVLGDMLELGKTSAKLHKELEKDIREAGIDAVFLAGAEMKSLAEALDKPLLKGHYSDWKGAAKDIEKFLRAGDVIMLKASNSLKFSDLVGSLREKYAPAAETA